MKVLDFLCTKETVGKNKDITVYKKQAPFTLRVELCERGILPFVAGDPRIKIIDGRTYEKTTDTIADLLMLR